jgi:precorrin-2/cobalt-factor-2 C20-methyltransferase
MAGKFYGLGVGPGDPKLLTIKAVGILRSVSVVAVPRSRADKNSIALEIARPYLPEGVEVLELTLPMTTDPVLLETSWQGAAETILVRLIDGQDVAFLTLGDPSLYSTYQFVLQKLMGMSPELNIETVPGITSFAASAALVNQPLAIGDEPLLILPAIDDNLGFYLEEFPNVVLMKVSRDFDQIVQTIDVHDKHGVFVSRCGSEQQAVVRDLNTLVGKSVDYLSLILVKNNPVEEGAHSK